MEKDREFLSAIASLEERKRLIEALESYSPYNWAVFASVYWVEFEGSELEIPIISIVNGWKAISKASSGLPNEALRWLQSKLEGVRHV